jgi:hypothetical protein
LNNVVIHPIREVGMRQEWFGIRDRRLSIHSGFLRLPTVSGYNATPVTCQSQLAINMLPVISADTELRLFYYEMSKCEAKPFNYS